MNGSKFSICICRKVNSLNLCHKSAVSSRVIKKNISSTNNKMKEKVTVVKRCYPSDYKNTPLVLETKDASSVIKRLNWEFKHLYGPLLNPKTKPTAGKKFYVSKQSVDYQAQPIAVSDPSVKSTYPDINIISDFPLMNKFSPKYTEAVFMSKANSLRDDLKNLCGSKQPSVSRILEKTMSEESAENLRRWKQKLIEELGEEGFKKYHAELLATGSSLHTSINNHLTSTFGEELLIEECNAGHWRSLKDVFPQIKNVRLLEERVSHPFLCYQGILDCFAEYRNQLVVIDWKTSKKSKSSLYSTFDNPLQIAAYVGALNFDQRLQYLVNNGLIVVAYENGAPATELFINGDKMLRYWKEWLKRVKKYWEMIESEKSQS